MIGKRSSVPVRPAAAAGDVWNSDLEASAKEEELALCRHSATLTACALVSKAANSMFSSDQKRRLAITLAGEMPKASVGSTSIPRQKRTLLSAAMPLIAPLCWPEVVV